MTIADRVAAKCHELYEAIDACDCERRYPCRTCARCRRLSEAFLRLTEYTIPHDVCAEHRAGGCDHAPHTLLAEAL